MRSPGIRLHKLALFGWAVVITAVLLLLSLPVLAGGITMVEKEGTEKPSGLCRIEPPATNHQIAGRP